MSIRALNFVACSMYSILRWSPHGQIQCYSLNIVCSTTDCCPKPLRHVCYVPDRLCGVEVFAPETIVCHLAEDCEQWPYSQLLVRLRKRFLQV